MTSFRLSPCAAAVAVALLHMAGPAQALDCTLVVNGPWQTPGDWNCNARPGSGDSATISVGGLVTINQAEQIRTLSNAGTITLNAGSLSLLGGGNTTNSGTINVGGVSTAALSVGNTVNNAGGTINVGAGSVVNQSGSTVSGGTIAGPGRVVASNSGANILSGLTFNAALDLATSAGSERFVGSTVNGAVAVNSNSIVSFEGNNTLNGTITLGNAGSSNRIGIDNSGVLTTSGGSLIHGQNGTIGQAIYIGGSSTLNNGGKISADVSGGTINLIATTTNNSGQLAAENGGRLVLSGTVNQTAAGTAIAVGAGSSISQNGVTVSGGTIGGTGGGAYTATNNGNNFLNAVSVTGLVDLASSQSSERITGGLTLGSGSNIAVNANSVLSFDGINTLTGTGTITLGAAGSGNRIGIDNSGTLTVDTGVLIHGQNGTIGQAIYIGGVSTLVNKGTIAADVAGGTINLVAATTNQGTLSASNGATLVLSSNVVGVAGSSIAAGGGSTVLQNGVTLSGAINTSGSGTLTATNSGNNYLNGVTLNGVLDLASSQASERVINNLVLNGTINVNANSVLSFEGANTLSGSANIVLGDSGASNRIGIDNSGTLTTSIGTQIHGQNGTIGSAIYVGGTPSLVNNGSINADVAGGQIELVAGTTNAGTLGASSGGRLVLSANVAGTATGSINAGAGSQVVQNGITISGIVNTTGTGLFTPSNSGNNYLSGVTLNGRLDLASSQASERVVGNLVLNGAIDINANSVLSFEGANTLSGNGTITLGNAGSSNRIGIDNSGVLTTSGGSLIHGQNGTIGQAIYVGGNSTLNNGGKVSADVSGGNINLLATTTNNSGQLAAQNGGRLVLSGSVNQTAAGTAIAVGAGSSIYQNGVTVSGGTIGGTGGGAYTASTSGNNFLNAVSVTGLLDLASSQSSERITGGLTLGGGSNIAVDANSILSFEGANTLTGTGTITLGAAGASNRIGIDNSGTLTVDTGVLIHGQNGTIGQAIYVGGTTSLVNKGTIAADVAGGLVTIVAGTVTNDGTLSASNGTLTVNSAFNGVGTARTAGTGQLNVGASSTVGRLINDGTTASALNLGTRNITVSQDYSNAGFGVGNAFNKRANVAGTGQILAAGNTAQAVTGTSVTNGGTGTPTLTIGNVRVGGTTYDYQVANTGTTGPALRGALQTTVNGGNITDARLSGSGVTASNYGPVATGANSGSLGVTFTVASAGALAPLIGQAVHIANNFSNVAEQTLNIALAAGAAAYNAAVGSTTPSPVVLANQRVAGAASQALTVANTASSGNFSEALNATFGGTTGAATTNGGSIAHLAAGSSNGSALSVGVNTATAGAKTGSVTIAYQTDGTGSNGHSGLAAIGAGSQTIAVSGNVYQTAAGSILTAPLNFGTVQVGQNVSQVLSVRNTASGPAGFVEDLNASFGAAFGTGGNLISGSGAVNGLVAGGNSSGLTVSVNTSQAGTVAGGIAVNFFSAGAVNGVSNGLGALAVGSSSYGVSGNIQAQANVVNQASPVVNNSPIALGNVRIGSASPTGLVSVTNQATTAPQAALNGSITGNGGVTASGSFNLLTPGATNASSLMVGLDTTTAGNKSGNATIAFVSDASNIGNCAPNCQMTIASQDVAVTGAVYRLANPVASPASVTVAGRVGSASPTTAINIANASPDLYTEGLSVTRGATSAGFTSSGGVTNLAAGGTSGAIGVVLDTTTAGTYSGTQVLNYVSTGAGTTGASDLAIGGGTVTLNGKVYTPAVATLDTPSVGFGIVHVGDVVSRGVSVTNSAPVTALNDVLVASSLGATGPFTASGNLGAGLAAGQTSTALTVGLDTGTAGIYSGSASFSAASHDGDLSDAALANLAVSLAGQVNNYATSAFSFGSGSGTLTQTGSTYVLDYGTVQQGSGTQSTSLVAANAATGPADLLDGTFQFLDPIDFGEAGFANFLSLMAGQTTGPLTLSFDSMTVGSFMDTIVLHGVGFNASGFRAGIGDIQLIVRGTVVGQDGPPTTNVPEPDSLILLGLGIPLLFLRRGRRRPARLR